MKIEFGSLSCANRGTRNTEHGSLGWAEPEKRGGTQQTFAPGPGAINLIVTEGPGADNL